MCDPGEARRVAALRKWFAEKAFIIPEGGVLVLHIHASLPRWLSDELTFSGGDEDYLFVCHRGDRMGEEMLGRLDDHLTISTCEDYVIDDLWVMLTCHS